MKSMVKQSSIWFAFLGFILLSTFAYAQNGNGNNNGGSAWNWPEDRKTAEERNVLYNDALKADNYEEAAKHLQWLLDNAPDLNASIYINGAKIYEALTEKASDKAQKEEYSEKTMQMYDGRAKYFGEKPSITDRKINTAFKLMYKDADKHEELYTMYKDAFDKYGSKSAYYNILPYMNLARLNYQAKKIDEDAVLATYDQVDQILSEQIEKGKNVEKLEETKENVDALLVSTIDLTCDQIEDKFASKLKANPGDEKLAEKIIKLSLMSNCANSAFFIKAAETSFNANPNAGMAKIIGRRKMAEESYDSALTYFNKALELTQDPAEKAELSLDLAKITYKSGDKNKAREMAMRAVENSETSSEAYTLIGNMYMGSYEQCRNGKNEIEDRAVFLAAYDMYQKAGNSQGMTNAKEQFPSKENIFNYNMNVGDNVKTGCWINTTTTIRTRD